MSEGAPRRRFRSSPEKDLIRGRYQKPLVQAFYERIGRPLRYFGLPGEELADLLAWSDMIGFVAAAEMSEPVLRQLRANLDVYFSHIEYGVHLGSIDRIIVSNQSKDPFSGQYQSIARAWSREENHFYWDFDVVYLDYFGKFLPYKRRRANADPVQDRANALRHLFSRDRQDAWQPWLLMVTVECRLAGVQDRDPLRRFLHQCKVGADQETTAALDFCLAESTIEKYQAARLVHGTLAGLVASAASNADVRVRPRPALIYQGTNTPMLFFAYELTRDRPIRGPIPLLHLLRVPHLEIRPPPADPWMALLPDQPPGLTTPTARRALDFLEQDVAATVLAGMRDSSQ